MFLALCYSLNADTTLPLRELKAFISLTEAKRTQATVLFVATW